MLLWLLCFLSFPILMHWLDDALIFLSIHITMTKIILILLDYFIPFIFCLFVQFCFTFLLFFCEYICNIITVNSVLHHVFNVLIYFSFLLIPVDSDLFNLVSSVSFIVLPLVFLLHIFFMSFSFKFSFQIIYFHLPSVIWNKCS